MTTQLTVSTAATLAQLFESQARKYGARTLLKAKQRKQWRDHSWEALANEVARLRAGLINLGLNPGDRVAIMAENGPHWVVFDQAVMGLGGIVVPLYTTSGTEETTQILNDSGARLVGVYGDALVRRLLALKPNLPALESFVTMHPDTANGATVSSGVQLTPQNALIEHGEAPAIEGSREDLATLIYTSGTTGPPKGAMLSHGNLLSNCESNMEALALGENDMTLSFLPVAHAFERTAGHYTVMAAGAMIAYAEGLTQIAQNLLEIEPTIVLTVPRLLEMIHSRIMRNVETASAFRRRLFSLAVATGSAAATYRLQGQPIPAYLAAPMALFRRLVFARIRGIFGSRLRYLISGGAPLPVAINQLLAAAEVPIVEGYGLTEASPVVAVNLHGQTKIGTVGRPLKNITARTADDGELLLHGPNIMKGYFNRDAETREVIDSGGWLHTGDIVQIDDDGYIRITDRKKEIIVLSGGKNISPANLETALMADRYVAQACVIGDRRKHLAALILPDFEQLADELARLGLTGKPHEKIAHESIAKDSRIRDFFQQRLREFNRSHSDVEAISAFRLIPEPFTQENGELTPTLKIRRRIIQQHYQSLIESMYE
ncbi:MAG TPA: long-chain fatty acid--CoA ligase [Candidatus Binataceae bacterium]|nr:long-chain fatty acid--CoA ligase [Candidatus Binataceae bacterium]